MTFKYSRQIYLGDTDAAGVVYFATGLSICHEAYEESLSIAGISIQQMIGEQKIALPIVRAEIDFIRPLFCGDRIQVNLNARSSDRTEFMVNYQVFNPANPNQIAIKAQTRHVCIDPNLRKRIDLPGNLLQWLKDFD